jgi:phosphatidylethanolamine-binding protein (PEBP) family uncharacterized protein
MLHPHVTTATAVLPTSASRRAFASRIATRLDRQRLGTLEVWSPDFEAGGDLPPTAAIGEAPALAWTAPPASAHSVVVLCEDRSSPEPFVHWLVYGIPAAVCELTGASASLWEEGTNSAGGTSFVGAARAAGDEPSLLHFEVFALDTVPELDPGADRAALVNAMRDHVVAYGELAGAMAPRVSRSPSPRG